MTSTIQSDTPANSAFHTQKRCRIAVFGHVTDPDEVSALLSQTLSLNRVDAKIRTRHIPGLLPDRMEPWRAFSLVEVLFEHGLTAAVFSESEIPSLEHPVVVHHAVCQEIGFEVRGLTGADVALIRWDDLELISVGEIPQEPPHHSKTGPLVVVSAASHGEDEHVDATVAHGPELWLIARRPERVFRVDYRTMNYEYLGPRMASSATANFRQLVDDIVNRAPQAWLTPSTHSWLQHDSQFKFAFPSSQALRDTTLTHLLMHRDFERQT